MKKKKILIVGFSHSVHTARWINQIIDQNFEIKLFPSSDVGAVCRELKKIDVYHSFYASRYNQNRSVNIYGKRVNNRYVAYGLRRLLRIFTGDYRARALTKLIREFQPDVIHSMEIQSAGYLVAKVRRTWKGNFPKWIVTNWGSDIYYFQNFPKHRAKISEVLSLCNYYSCECRRDIKLAKNLGLKSSCLPVFPNSGGYDLGLLSKFQKFPPSVRKTIMVKGYQHFAGRALTALEALKISDIRGFEVWVYSVQPGSGVDKAFKKFGKENKVKINIIPLGTEHKKMIEYFSKARIAIGLSISDAISTMVLESMVTGCFPIQSNTSCANEWIEHQKTGFIVPPDDPEQVAKAICRALSDDELVDQGAEENYKIAKKRLDEKVIRHAILDFYKRGLKGDS